MPHFEKNILLNTEFICLQPIARGGNRESHTTLHMVEGMSSGNSHISHTLSPFPPAPTTSGGFLMTNSHT